MKGIDTAVLIVFAIGTRFSIAFNCPSNGGTHETATEITCFWTLSGSPNPTTANSMCITEGGQLAIVNDSVTNTALYNYLQSSGYGGYPAINVVSYDDVTLETFDGRPVTYNNWEGGQPQQGEDCTVMRTTTGQWFDIPCSQYYGGVCSHTEYLQYDPTEKSSLYNVVANSKLMLTQLSTHQSRSRSECAIFCNVTEGCKAVNYYTTSRMCELLSDNHESSGVSYSFSPTTDYIYNSDYINN